ncbi:MAG TPA: hypothetical protein VNG33_14795 [Polyangiaceae bacterium]|nr:hypothetical protein [Polyangiaceae bacterium]
MMRRSLFVFVLVLPLQLFGCRTAPEAGSAGYATRTSSGEVSFAITPRLEGSRLVFNVHSDTHSGDLADLDLGKAFTLDADGKVYRPVETRAFRGHHSDGAVAFDVGTAPSRFSLTISGVRSAQDVKLAWP